MPLSVTQRLIQGEDGYGNKVLETVALRARMTRASDSSAVIVQLWHEAVDAAASEREWPKRHPNAATR